MIVDVDPGVDLPLAIDERLGGERAEDRLIESRKESCRLARYRRMGRALSSVSSAAMRALSAARAKKVSVAEAGEDPALDDLYRDFDLRLAIGGADPARQRDGAVVSQHIAIKRIEGAVVERSGVSAPSLRLSSTTTRTAPPAPAKGLLVQLGPSGARSTRR